MLAWDSQKKIQGEKVLLQVSEKLFMNIVKELKFTATETLKQHLSSFQLDAWRSRLSFVVVLLNDICLLPIYCPKLTISQPGLFTATETVTDSYNVKLRVNGLQDNFLRQYETEL